MSDIEWTDTVWNPVLGCSQWADGMAPIRTQSVVASPWWIGPIGWVLTDIALPEPVPCKGFQGLWNLPADVESAVLAQLAKVPR